MDVGCEGFIKFLRNNEVKLCRQSFVYNGRELIWTNSELIAIKFKYYQNDILEMVEVKIPMQ